MSLIRGAMPGLAALRTYQRGWLTPDLLGGVTVRAMLVLHLVITNAGRPPDSPGRSTRPHPSPTSIRTSGLPSRLH